MHPGFVPTLAADTVYSRDPALGLVLMADLPDCAEPEVAWGMAERVARKAQHPLLWTADSVAEARNGGERSRESLGGLAGPCRLSGASHRPPGN